MKSCFIIYFLLIGILLVSACTPGLGTSQISTEASPRAIALLTLQPGSETPFARMIVPTQDILAAWHWIFDSPPNPIDLNVVLDPDHAVEAVISTQGGMLTTTDTNGTRYTLQIPPDALVVDTLIRMTPVQSVSDLPLQEEKTSWAVQLEPEGQQLFDIATLTITPTTPIPVDQQIPFGYQGEGDNFTLAAPTEDPVIDASAIQINLMHFSGYGAARGYLTDLEEVRLRLGGSIEDRIFNEIAKDLIRQRNGQPPLIDDATWQAILVEYNTQVLQPRIKTASESCGAGILVLQTILRIERMMQLLGINANNLDAGSTPFPLPAGFEDMVAKRCMQEEYEMCRDQHIIHRIIPVVLGMERLKQLLGADSGGVVQSQENWGLVEKCLNFELEFSSTTIEIHWPGMRVELKETTQVKSTVEFALKDYVFTGKGLLRIEANQTEQEDCSFTSLEGNEGTLYIDNLNWTTAYNTNDELGFVKDLALYYTVGYPSGDRDMTCLHKNAFGFPSQPAAQTDIDVSWWITYSTLHAEQSPETGFNAMSAAGKYPNQFVFTGWEVLGGELYAVLEWSKTGSQVDNPTPNQLMDSGFFKLYHRPK